MKRIGIATVALVGATALVVLLTRRSGDHDGVRPPRPDVAQQAADPKGATEQEALVLDSTSRTDVASTSSYVVVEVTSPDGGPAPGGTRIWGWRPSTIDLSPQVLGSTDDAGSARVVAEPDGPGVAVAGIEIEGEVLHPDRVFVRWSEEPIRIATQPATPSVFFVDDRFTSGSVDVAFASAVDAGFVPSPSARSLAAAPPSDPALVRRSTDVHALWAPTNAGGSSDGVDGHSPAHFLVRTPGSLDSVVRVLASEAWLIPVPLRPAGSIRVSLCPENVAQNLGFDLYHFVARRPGSESVLWQTSALYGRSLEIGPLPPGEIEVTARRVASAGAQVLEPVVEVSEATTLDVSGSDPTEWPLCFRPGADEPATGELVVELLGFPDDLPANATTRMSGDSSVMGISVALNRMNPLSLPGLPSSGDTKQLFLSYDGAGRFYGGSREVTAGTYQIISPRLALFGEVTILGGERTSVSGSLGRPTELEIHLLDATTGESIEGLIGFGQAFPGLEPPEHYALGMVNPVEIAGRSTLLFTGRAQAYVAADGYVTSLRDFTVDDAQRTLTFELAPMPRVLLHSRSTIESMETWKGLVRAEFSEGPYAGLENPLKVQSVEATDGGVRVELSATFEGRVRLDVFDDADDPSSFTVALDGGATVEIGRDRN